MKKLIKNFQHSIFSLLKIFLYISLLTIFFVIFSFENAPLLHFSRTSGVTLVTFLCVGLAMTAAYGGYNVGVRKSKPIIYSMSLSAVITDIVTYLELSIMNVNPNNNSYLKFEHLGLLAVVVILQVLVITGLTYFGNYVFFRINRPERCCIIASSRKSADSLKRRVEKYKKQYKVIEVISYNMENLLDRIEPYDTVFICDVPVETRIEIIEYCYRCTKNIYFCPEIADIVEINAKHIVMDDMSMIAATVKGLTFEQRILKRTMDIVFSLIAIVVSSPIWVVCALSVKLCDGGKIFFKQKRATINGKVFEVYKFRTMRENVTNYSSQKDDDRITPVGKVLRKIRMDELPQLLNILKGDMSIVGPRPEMLENIYAYTKDLPEFEYRLRVKAGLTGYAQIAGKYNTSPKEKLFLDLMYIEGYSIWKDIKLILQTLIIFFKSDSTEAFTSDDIDK